MRVSSLQDGGKYYCSVGHFPSYCEKMQDKRSLKKEGLAFGSQFEGADHHVGERTAAGL